MDEHLDSLQTQKDFERLIQVMVNNKLSPDNQKKVKIILRSSMYQLSFQLARLSSPTRVVVVFGKLASQEFVRKLLGEPSRIENIVAEASYQAAKMLEPDPSPVVAATPAKGAINNKRMRDEDIMTQLYLVATVKSRKSGIVLTKFIPYQPFIQGKLKEYAASELFDIEQELRGRGISL